jgi:uncharacterized repeat protein (TIGR01451 family)
MSRHKLTWLTIILIALALFVTACGTTSQPPTVSEKAGNLELMVQGVEQAQVMVALDGKIVFDQVVHGSQKIESLKPGQYAVDGMPLQGVIDPTAQTVAINPEETTKVILIYTQLQEPTNAPTSVAHLSIQAVQDEAGKTLPSSKEVNTVKDVMLYAAQTEESVCVYVKATDLQNNPVANAQLSINVADDFPALDRVAIIRGCAKKETQSLMPALFRDGIFTDEQGMAAFTLYASFGSPTGEVAKSTMLGDAAAKIVVAAENKEGTAVLTEFKMFFFNISHLYFNGTYTGERVGKAFEEQNIFDPRSTNVFDIQASLTTKQPQSELSISSVGYMRYEVLEELNKKGESADVIYLDACDEGLTTGLKDKCEKDFDGLIKLVPQSSLTLKDLPIRATVKGTLVVIVRFGSETYTFNLKDFIVTKHWIGSFLSIDKVIDHHVLTWAGPEHHLFEAPKPNNLSDHTLAATNDKAISAGSVFTAMYTITAKNEGTEPLYNITLADALPAELGVITSTLTPGGGTYDAVNHVVTWNWMAVADPRFDKLEPGASISATVEVYIRQKPGFCMDQDDRTAAMLYQVKPVAERGCYSDPYSLVNGKEPEDVTATFYTGKPLGEGGHQVKADFAGEMHKGQVILYAVRPTFEITKVLIDPKRPMDVGEVAYFDITIKNLHRTRYDALESEYAQEFTGSRYNPYGRNVQVKDVFDLGLDFVSASPLAISGASYAEHFVPDKGILWDSVPVMDYKATGTARIALRANLPSPEAMQPSELKLSCIGVECVPEEDYWYNCAFLDADNLNQPQETWNGDIDWTQYEKRPWEYQPLHHGMLENLRYGLRACASVKVLPPPGEPWIELDSLSEYSAANPSATMLPGVSDGQTYAYFFTVTNTGAETAKGVALETKLDCAGKPARVTPDTKAHSMYVYNHGSSSWMFVANASFAGPEGGQCTVRFAPQDLPYGEPNPVFLYIVEVTATDAGEAHITAKTTYSNANLQLGHLPLEVTEDTSISPE